MAASVAGPNEYVLFNNASQQHRYDTMRDPEERIRRRGVPDHRARFRETKSGSENWKLLNKKILQVVRLRIQAGKFNYKDLPLSKKVAQIRLLYILPAKTHDAPLICDLEVMNLDMVVNRYEALSYCWGTEEPDQFIAIRCKIWDEKVGEYRRSDAEDFPVRSNLLKALKHLRGPKEGFHLWVDAICINQRPTPDATLEKNGQLSMMSRIYNSAKNVCIWLGDSDESSRQAFLLLNSVTNFNTFHQRLHDKEVEGAKQKWRSLVETLKGTKWFSRRWIIQEIASARSASVHCGKDIVHWDDLAAAISLLDENSDFMDRQFGHSLFSEIPTLSATQLVKALTNVCRKTSTGEISERLLDFETLVCTFQQFQATFPQDVIHSVRALANDAYAESAPDWKDDNAFGLGVDVETSTRDLFIAFVKRCIKTSGSLDIICRHWAPAVKDTVNKRIKLPSWISELSNGPYGAPGESHERQNGENFVAISPNYKWRRYNVSDNWMATKKQGQPPTLRVQHVNETIKQGRWSFPVAGFSPKDIVESPTMEKNGFFETVNTDDGQVPRRTNSRVRLEDANELLDDPSTYKGLLQNARGAASNATPPQNETYSERPATPLPTQRTQHSVSSARHKRSSTMPSIGRPASRQQTLTTVLEHEDRWMFLMKNAMSPNKIKAVLPWGGLEDESHSGSFGKQDSKALQESYEQKDKEHRTKFNGQLEVQGIILGKVQECSDMMRDGIVTGDWLEKLGWHDGPHNSVSDQLWRLLVADKTANGSDPPEWYSRACLHCLKDSRLVNSRGDFNSHKKVPLEEPLDPMTATYLKRVESVIWRRRIVRLGVEKVFGGDAFFGLAPERTREGDYVCILAGCSVPVILKKLESKAFEVPPPAKSAGVFELVGEAFVHRVMNGEAIRLLKREGKFEECKEFLVLQ